MQKSHPFLLSLLWMTNCSATENHLTSDKQPMTTSLTFITRDEVEVMLRKERDREGLCLHLA